MKATQPPDVTRVQSHRGQTIAELPEGEIEAPPTSKHEPGRGGGDTAQEKTPRGPGVACGL
jgi:hypothetical protein